MYCGDTEASIPVQGTPLFSTVFYRYLCLKAYYVVNTELDAHPPAPPPLIWG